MTIKTTFYTQAPANKADTIAAGLREPLPFLWGDEPMGREVFERATKIDPKAASARNYRITVEDLGEGE